MANSNCPNRRSVASLLFRLVYGCGLQISEALRLRLCDVDLEQEILTIWESKFHASRLVPMTTEMSERCLSYLQEVHLLSDADMPLFMTAGLGYYDHRTITHMYRQVLHIVGVPYFGQENGPRIHALRHTMAVNCLKKWVHEGKNLTSILPHLSPYPGHKDLNGTQDYLRLTAEMFPEVTRVAEKCHGYLIPAGGVHFETE